MQRRSNWTPAIVSNRVDRTDRKKTVSEADGIVAGPELSALTITYIDNTESEGTPKVLDPEIQRQADLRFTIGVALALALPVFIGIGVYIATTAILKAS